MTGLMVNYIVVGRITVGDMNEMYMYYCTCLAQLINIKQSYNQWIAHIKNRKQSSTFQLLSVAIFMKYQCLKTYVHCYTALSYVNGKMYSSSKPLEDLCAVGFKNCVKIVIIQEVHCLGKGGTCPFTWHWPCPGTDSWMSWRISLPLKQKSPTHVPLSVKKVSLLLLETLHVRLLECEQNLIYMCEWQEGHYFEHVRYFCFFLWDGRLTWSLCLSLFKPEYWEWMWTCICRSSSCQWCV